MESNLAKKDHKILFTVSTSQLGHPIWILPTFGFLSCVGLSLIYDFEASTGTHCRVRNYLPSISSAIGGYTPQRYIWRICIGLHSWPRLLLIIINYMHYSSFRIDYKPELYKLLLAVNALLHALENLGLVVLSMVSSTENYDIHKMGFITFIACSLLYMLLTCILFKWSRSSGNMSPKDERSYKYKTRLLVFNFMSFIVAAYFFYRHNAYCEAGIYTLFSLAEYFVVMSNIAFHCSDFFLDFPVAWFAFNVPGRWTTLDKHH